MNSSKEMLCNLQEPIENSLIFHNPILTASACSCIAAPAILEVKPKQLCMSTYAVGHEQLVKQPCYEWLLSLFRGKCLLCICIESLIQRICTVLPFPYYFSNLCCWNSLSTSELSLLFKLLLCSDPAFFFEPA